MIPVGHDVQLSATSEQLVHFRLHCWTIEELSSKYPAIGTHTLSTNSRWSEAEQDLHLVKE